MNHCIIVKWKENVDKKALSEEVRALYSAAAEIEGVRKVTVKDNVTPRPNRYDIMIVLEIEDSALEIWDASELHKKWKSQYGDLIEKKCIFDGGDE